jgi:hypothetical protein
MVVQFFSFRNGLHLRGSGFLLLLLLITFVNPVIGQTSPLLIKMSPYPNHRVLTTRIGQSRKILHALLLEKRYRYADAREIWKTLPQSSESVRDHIFQNELVEREYLDQDSVPATVYSVKVAASFFVWKKQWRKAYELLKSQPALLARHEGLRLMRIITGLYLRKYDEVERQLNEADLNEALDRMELGLVQSWFYILSERTTELHALLKELDENAYYMPDSFAITRNVDSSWQETKNRALKALTRFPSDRELIENIVKLYQQNSAWEELETAIGLRSFKNTDKTAWTVLAEVYLQTRQLDKLKRLLEGVALGETTRVEYFSYNARLAIHLKKWKQLRQIAEQVKHRFPFLRDGGLLMDVYILKAGDPEL